MSQVSSAFGIRLAVKDLFLYPTIASLSKLVDAKLSKDGKQPVAISTAINLVDEVNKHDQGIVKYVTQPLLLNLYLKANM